MSLTPEEQELVDLAVGTLPSWFSEDQRALEDMALAAKQLGPARAQLAYWFDQALITQAVGPIGPEPDWLNQHALDRGTSRQNGETDVALRARIKNVPDALTRPAILSAAQQIIEAEAITGTVAMVELPLDASYLVSNVSNTGVGGTFAAGMRFTPAAHFAAPPLRLAHVPLNYKLVLTGAAAGGNNGSFDVTGLDGNAAVYANGSGVVGVDAGVTWKAVKYDLAGNKLDDFAASYLDRGYRATGPAHTMILILPLGSTTGTVAAILEMLRQKKGAGVVVIVERKV
jgi:hypothetical protein